LRYPPPEHDAIIEPFAGAAGYATRYADRKITLVERDPIIANLWKYLTRVSPQEIMAIPTEVPGTVDELAICEEARWLVGFWCNKGAASPRKSPSAWMRSGIRPRSYWGEAVREKIASQVEAIRHWEIIEGSYEQAPDVNATWFIDPPYQQAGKHYRFKLESYETLAVWCEARRGQVMVCEQEGATWLPFQTFATIKSTPGTNGKSYSSEVMWVKGCEPSASCLVGFDGSLATDLGS